MNESIDHVVADWLREGPESGPREGLGRALAATRRVGQRPGWTLPERWIPMQQSMARTRTQQPILAIATLALLMVALVATIIYVGSRLSTPSLYRNGAVVWAADGDLFIADQLDGTPRALVPGPETDSDPIFSVQGDRVAFIRDTPDDSVMAVSLDGSGVVELARLAGVVGALDWSPDGSRLLASTLDVVREADSDGLQTLGLRNGIEVINSDGSGSRKLDFGQTLQVQEASWRPDGRHIAFVGEQEDAGLGVFIADADGTNPRRLPIDAVVPAALEWSPDGKHLSFMSLDGNNASRISIADIDKSGAMTDRRQLKLDGSEPKWSPDGSQLAFVVGTISARRARVDRVGIVNADGSANRLVGPEVDSLRATDFDWAPDGRSLVIFEHNGFDVPVGLRARAWTVDVATGEQTEVQTPVQSWQRLAP